MSYLGQNSKSSITTTVEDSAFKKISDSISHLHSVLVPLTNNKGVYRDLTEEEDYLLTNLEENSFLHSVLAGCLAIDSCINNIFETEKIATGTLIQNHEGLIDRYHSFESLINNSSVKDMNKIKQFADNFSKNIKDLLENLSNLPFVDKSKVMELSTKMNNGSEVKRSSTSNQKLQKFHSNQGLKNSQGEQILEGSVNNQKNIIKSLKEQFLNQKAFLNREIDQLQEEISILQKYTNVNLVILVQKLKSEIQCLESERSNDEQLFAQIQEKMEYMTISNYRNKKYHPLIRQSNIRNRNIGRNNNQNHHKQRVKSSYGIKRDGWSSSRARLQDKGKLHYEVFNNLPVRKSIVTDQEEEHYLEDRSRQFNPLTDRPRPPNIKIRNLQCEFQSRKTLAPEPYRSKSEPYEEEISYKLNKKIDNGYKEHQNHQNRRMRMNQRC